jgi:hypothetical protein
MVESQMTNGARGEIAMELGGVRYVLSPEFGIVAKIENALDTSMIKLAMKAEVFDLKAEDLVRTLRVVLAAHGHEVAEEALAEAIAEEGVATVLVPLALFLRGYVWGGGQGKKDAGARTDKPKSPPKNGKNPATSSAPA